MNKNRSPLAVFLMIAILIPVSSFSQVQDENGIVESRDIVTLPPNEHQDPENIIFGSNQFTPNEGQLGNSDVIYYTSGGQISTGFRENGLTVSVSGEEIGHSYFVDFYGGQSNGPEGELELEHRSNFFFGSDSDMWQTDVINYERIRYQNVWDEIDIVYRTVDGRLKYDVIIHPGGDPEDIRFKFDGVKPGIIGEDLVIETKAGIVIDDGPVTIQSEDIIPSRWITYNDGSVGFEVADYDRSQDVIIDPGFRYSSYAGGSSIDRTRDMVVDSSGYMYITGYTASSNFPTISGSYDTTFNGGNNGDIFVMKVNISGDRLIYSTYLGGSGNDYGMSVDVDSSGSAYVCGQSYSNNYPTPSGYDTGYSNNGDAVVTKLSSAGNSITYSTYLGGWAQDTANGIRVNSAGNAFVTGMTDYVANNWPQQWRFPVTSGAYDSRHNGNEDVFVTKLNTNGRGLSYSTLIGSGSDEYGNSIDIDSSGYAYITGYTTSSGFPTTSGSYDRTYGGSGDAIVVKVGTTGTSLSYSTFMGGSGLDRGNAILLDSSNRAYITGDTQSSNYPTTTDAYDTSYGGNTDAFVSLLSSTGATMVNSTYLGHTGQDYGRKLFLDGDDNIFVSGQTSSTNFPVTSDALQSSRAGGFDAFITKFDIGGTGLIYSTFIGGTNDEDGRGVHVDSVGFIYIAGTTNSANYPTTFIAFDRTHNSNDDVFFSKFYPADFSPTGLATSAGYFWVNLTWDPPTTPIVGTYGIVGYNVYRGITQSSLVPIATVSSGTHYNDTINFFTSRTYYYFVTAILNTIGEGGESNMVSGTPQVTPGPVDPVAVEGDMFVNLTWSMLDQNFLDIFDIEYTVYRSITPSFMTELTSVGEQGWYYDDDVPPRPITYYYQISYKIIGVGQSNRTNIISASPRTPPGEPEDIELSPMDLEMNLSWAEPSKNGGYPVSGYKIYRGPTSDLMQLFQSVNDTTFTYFDTDIIPGDTYFYSITAENNLGDSVHPQPIDGMGQTVPSPPRDMKTVPENQRINVEWKPPQYDWGTTITGYSIYRGLTSDDMSLHMEVSGDHRSYLDTVENGVTFFYSVSASNIHGESDEAGPLETMATGIPGVVPNVSSEIGDETVQIFWDEVVDNGGLPILAYKVHRGPQIDNMDTEFVLSSKATTFIDTGLTNGVTYYYRVTAMNLKGEGALSSAVIATPGRVSTRITQIAVAGGLNSAMITWTNPTDLGGREGLNIQIYRGASPSSLAPYELVPFTEQEHNDRGLKAGIVYYYALSVVNPMGESKLSPIVSTLIYGKPSEPMIESVTSTSRRINITWVPPENDGGRPLMDYVVYIRSEGEIEWEKKNTDELFHLFTGLSLGIIYDIRVSATNDLAEGDPSETVKVLVGDPPEEPRDLRIDILKPEVRVSWNPRPQISLPVIGYRVYMQVGNGEPFLWKDVDSNTKEIIVKGLIKGTNYSFAVSAYNIIGEGKKTTFKEIDPSSVPEAVTWAWLNSVGHESVEIFWTQPEFTGGRDIVSYTVYRGSVPAATDVIASGLTSLSFTDVDVINGRTYYYRIKAHNINEGGSEYSDSIMARPVGTPSIPMAFEASPTTDSVELSWIHPDSDGGDAVTGYLIFKGSSEEDLELYADLSPNSTMFTDRDVKTGSYLYRIIAENPNGRGKAAQVEVDVPSRLVFGLVVGGISLFLPILVILMILLIPGYLKKRKDEKESKKKEAEEEELRIRKMRAEGLANRGLPGMHQGSPALGGAQRSAMGPAMSAPTLPPSREPEPAPTASGDGGYIRPTEMKKTKKDKKTILRADGKSMEHRRKEEEQRDNQAVKDHHKGKKWEEESKKVLEEEARNVFTGQQTHGHAPAPAPVAPAPAPAPVQMPVEEEEPVDEGPVPTVSEVLKEVPEWGDGDDEASEDIPTWGEEEPSVTDIPQAEPPVIDEEDIEDLDEIEEIDDIEEIEEYEE